MILIASHTIADYAKWRKVFDSAQQLREEAGLREPTVLRGLVNPLEMTIIFKMADYKKAQAFLDSPTTRELIVRAGVTSVPEFTFLLRGEEC